jgi:uncharacterized integral membrane protein
MQRYLSIAIIVLFAALVGLFTLQNMEDATLTFLSVSVAAPISLLVFLVYILGMVTGWLVVGVLRKAVEDSRKNDAGTE